MPPVLEIKARLGQESEIQSGFVTGERVRGRRGRVVLGAPGVRAAGTLVFGGLRPGAGTQTRHSSKKCPAEPRPPCPAPQVPLLTPKPWGATSWKRQKAHPPLVWGLRSSAKRQGLC